jgi:hypothetical protein
MTNAYEKLGAFYLGKRYDLDKHQLTPELTLYDAKDLTTHAVIIGMTGSGKTGLGIGLLEEALIDHVPVIAIDPKGDLPNLSLTFPNLEWADFQPWVDPQAAASKGLTVEQFAKQQAESWRAGLADWGQPPQRIERLKQSAAVRIYTPGSSAGLPVSVLRNFAPPPAALAADVDLFRERVQSTTTALLALLGIEADPLTSREHILLANIFENIWSQGKGLDLPGLINAIQSPPFERVGVMELDLFYPAKERFALAMRINNLLAAPGFEAWLTGASLDVGRLLHTPGGKPVASIFSIGHLSDTQRMFFVATLLNEVLAWVRTQPGTASLRAILYMDEIFGFIPPVGNPPSKRPLLTLLKQARAFGLGVVLSTQNPVDLDYKGLSNTGTWFVGRLQTERDKSRLLAGLEGAAADNGFDSNRMEEILAGLSKRTFLLHNVHETAPTIFQTRWAMSYLCGPMTREQIKRLTEQTPTQEATESLSGTAAASKVSADETSLMATPPSAPADVDTFYLAASGAGKGLHYEPAVVGRMDVHYFSARYHVEATQTVALMTTISDDPVPVDWDHAVEIDPDGIETEGLGDARYGKLPAEAQRASAFKKWQKDLLRWVRQNRSLEIYRSKKYKLTSHWDEPQSAFRARLSQVARETRDLKAEKLRAKYHSRFSTLSDRLMRAEQTVEKEREQVETKKMRTVVSLGETLLGAFMGRKVISARSTSRMSSAMRSASQVKKERMDVARALERVSAVQQHLSDLETRFQADLAKLDDAYDAASEQLSTITIKPKSADIILELFGMAWAPYRLESDGKRVADWR